MPNKIIPILLIVSFIFPSCKPGGRKSAFPDASAFKKTLIKKQVPGTNYFISLPANYIIKKSNGPDFSVYYFYSADTTNHTSFLGGFYLGNSPGAFATDSCKQSQLKSYLLGAQQDWTLYNCNNRYIIQIITNSRSKYDWARFIHAFGSCKSMAELNKLFDVYSTLEIN
jgi:hypothetical protein